MRWLREHPDVLFGVGVLATHDLALGDDAASVAADVGFRRLRTLRRKCLPPLSANCRPEQVQQRE
jgi:hypothetical protein